MRELRFRQWVKNQNRFRYWGYGRDNSFTSPLGSVEDDIRESMQFTGLEDKNGRGIYEGDIVTFEINNCSFVGEIKFECGCFIIGCDGIEDSYIKMCELEIEENSSWQIRVLGNKIENPKLLEGLKNE